MLYGQKECHDIYKEYVACSDTSGCGLGSDGLAWDYQVNNIKFSVYYVIQRQISRPAQNYYLQEEQTPKPTCLPKCLLQWMTEKIIAVKDGM